mmetsp:Transcript_37049/g.51103  ORF Transcript_37049/g.51103 Transcript_37049/m.51103 type:complete len:144 (+) Transcript_37049:137-568(+)
MSSAQKKPSEFKIFQAITGGDVELSSPRRPRKKDEKATVDGGKDKKGHQEWKRKDGSKPTSSLPKSGKKKKEELEEKKAKNKSHLVMKPALLPQGEKGDRDGSMHKTSSPFSSSSSSSSSSSVSYSLSSSLSRPRAATRPPAF